MKTPQRTFVVERKSGRRRSTMQPASIWGDTDLKALVRKAEADAPHLFEPNMVTYATGHDTEPQTVPAPGNHPNDKTDTSHQKPIMTPPIEAEQNSPPQQDVEDLTLGPIPKLKGAAPKPGSPKVAKRGRASSGYRQPDGTKISPTTRSTAAQVKDYADELVSLDQENGRLKGLLALHFREQNIQLRTMLARFSVG